MLGRVLGRTLTTLGLLCATLAWTCWVYLHTVGDPTRIERIADAVLADAEARLEISAFISDQLMESVDIDPTYRPMVETAVETALSDPRITTDVIDAFAAEHANALGIDDPRDTTIDTAALVEATRQHLAEIDPTLAALIPADAAAQIGEVTLPKYRPPGAGTVRDLAGPAAGTLTAIAAVLLGISLVAGERRRTVRRIGTWALISGLGWLVGPLVIAAAAEQWFPDASATVRVITEEYARSIRVASSLLVGGGVIALVAWALPIWPRQDEYGDGPYAPQAAHGPQGPQPDWATAQAYRTSLANGPVAGAPAPTMATGITAGATAPPHTRPVGPVDTFVRSGDAPAMHQAAWTPAPPATPVHDIWSATAPAPGPAAPPPPAPAPAPAPDIDPWAAFFGDDR